MTRIARVRLYNSAAIVLTTLAVAVALGSLTGCEYQNDKRLDSSLEEANVSRPVTYFEVNERIFKPHCVECHVSRGPVLTDYASAKKGADLIRQTVLVEKRMPKSGPLAPELRSLLRAWLDAGAPDGEPLEAQPSPSPEPSAEPSAEPGTAASVTWEQVHEQVFTPRCTRCHFPENDDAVIDLESPEVARQNFEKILNQALADKMPPSKNKLTREQKLLLSRWVIDGLL